MSKDYPNRQEWLDKRATPRKRTGTFLYVSTNYQYVPQDNGSLKLMHSKGKTHRKPK